MRREGRQHGMVRTYRILPSPLNPRPESRFVNRFDSPPTAGLFNKVQSKPTNHSKFTGKCGKAKCNECHIHPATKSKDKGKGTQKLRSSERFSYCRLIMLSASRMLDHLSDEYSEDDDVDQNLEEEFQNEENVAAGDKSAGDDDDEMSFCDVGFVLEQIEGDEGWCLVGEM